MSHAVLGLGAAALCVSGCVWYLPAVADLRAGDDRPRHRRTAAAACLSGWATTALLAPLLFLCAPWPVVAAVALTGAVLTAGLGCGAAVCRRRERRAAREEWAELTGGAGAAAVIRPTGRDTARLVARPRRTVAGLLLAGPLTAGAAAAAVLYGGPAGGGRTIAALAAVVSLTGLSLGAAGLRAHAAARRAR
ncbi:hypothetical protein [Streptomyces caatingaensis]|uniref:hypothetical protein n=1 Tax=Streptomyces caatingaensis TaxID=1678637 RepID=UPI000A533652|nr:hypothetical protein [Streptomyces caatingaensis]